MVGSYVTVNLVGFNTGASATISLDGVPWTPPSSPPTNSTLDFLGAYNGTDCAPFSSAHPNLAANRTHNLTVANTLNNLQLNLFQSFQFVGTPLVPVAETPSTTSTTNTIEQPSTSSTPNTFSSMTSMSLTTKIAISVCGGIFAVFLTVLAWILLARHRRYRRKYRGPGVFDSDIQLRERLDSPTTGGVRGVVRRGDGYPFSMGAFNSNLKATPPIPPTSQPEDFETQAGWRPVAMRTPTSAGDGCAFVPPSQSKVIPVLGSTPVASAPPLYSPNESSRLASGSNVIQRLVDHGVPVPQIASFMTLVTDETSRGEGTSTVVGSSNQRPVDEPSPPEYDFMESKKRWEPGINR
ncbi:hypothetical protein FRB98_002839 [Tulasnella sp. 332]|nr:hypothetical protein FRB98_002839 [Tulasnella sp. 332]